MRIVYSILLMIAAIQVQAQDCSMITTEHDEMTGDTIYNGEVIDISRSLSRYIPLRLKTIDGQMYFGIAYATIDLNGNVRFQMVTTDSKMIVMFLDGTKFTTARQNVTGITHGAAQFPLTEKEVDLLRTKTIRKIRVYLHDSYGESEIKPKKAMKIKDTANCLALIN